MEAWALGPTLRTSRAWLQSATWGGPEDGGTSQCFNGEHSEGPTSNNFQFIFSMTRPKPLDTAALLTQAIQRLCPSPPQECSRILRCLKPRQMYFVVPESSPGIPQQVPNLYNTASASLKGQNAQLEDKEPGVVRRVKFRKVSLVLLASSF